MCVLRFVGNTLIIVIYGILKKCFVPDIRYIIQSKETITL